MKEFLLTLPERIINRITSIFYWFLLPHMEASSRIYRDAELKGLKYIHIGKGTVIMKHAVITAYDNYEGVSQNPLIKIGNHVSIGEYAHITSFDKVVIGDNVLFGRRVTISDNNHGSLEWDQLQLPPLKRKLTSKGPVIIEDDVWIGENAVVLSGVTVGRGSIIGANSVVTHNVPPYSLCCGNPARIIKTIDNSNTK